MTVVLRPGGWKTHFDPAVFITMNFFAGGTDDQHTLQARIWQVDARIVGRDYRNIPAHA